MADELSGLVGAPARAALGQCGSPAFMADFWWAGTVERVDPEHIAVALMVTTTLSSCGTHASLEVLHGDGLYRFWGEIAEFDLQRSRFVLDRTGDGSRWELVQRRRHKRVPIAIPAWISDGNRYWQTTAVNLSLGGVALLAQPGLDGGQAVQVGFGPGHGLPMVPLDGTVVRVAPQASGQVMLGVMLFNLSPRTEAMIQSFINQVRPGDLVTTD